MHNVSELLHEPANYFRIHQLPSAVVKKRLPEAIKLLEALLEFWKVVVKPCLE
jgi:hypothetical protein